MSAHREPRRPLCTQCRRERCIDGAVRCATCQAAWLLLRTAKDVDET